MLILAMLRSFQNFRVGEEGLREGECGGRVRGQRVRDEVRGRRELKERTKTDIKLHVT